MPRRPRIHLPGVPQHVIQRGVDRQPVFFSDDDCRFYLDWLGEYASKRDIALHAYCLMTNHVHLVLSAPSAGALPGLMQDMGRRYVQYVNRTYHRSGGLWQGRYKASYVQSERYLLACMRYVELNPVRARMVQAPGEYRWSSYRANALGEEDKLLTPHDQYLAIGSTAEQRQQTYRGLFATEVDEPAWALIRTATQQGVVVGDSRFAEMIEKRLGQIVRPRPRGRPGKNKTIEERIAQ
ncbi:Transposase IS200 like protein [Tepidimonas thermarum]|uniref:Transposase IS200 like protein n=1 Tax=Tepidimonas thermarum TaxID=335431 RepID=A0A554WWR1_9BURK|nr:transposase [Tepidimonas thermarum]TSE28020.1 Transposase IS200 like protein [Tepidimonas thermarum]